MQLKLEQGELQLRIWPRRAINKPGGGRKLERDVTSFTLDERDGGTKPVVVKQFDHPPSARAAAQPPPPDATATYDPCNRPFYIPYHQKGDHVIGREGALAKVRQQLTVGRRTAIGQVAVFQGLGGLGKTQLAVEYAYRCADEYPNGVIWLTADQDIDAQLVDLAIRARWVAPETEHKFKLEIARHRLRNFSGCLIVFDNLEQVSAIKGYLPEPPAEPHILATSRIEQPDFTFVPIDVLDPDQSLRLLIQEAGHQPGSDAEWEAARQIAATLVGLPLALELAGAYLSRRPVGWHDYLQLLQMNLRHALPHGLSSLTRHEADLYSTLHISEELFAEEPRLREILDVLAWSAPAPMGQDLLAVLLGTQSRTELTGALGLGTALRILQHLPETDSYAIHRLVREVRREEIPLAERGPRAADLCRQIGDWFDALREDFRQLPRFEAEIDHLRQWHEHSLKFAPMHSSRFTWLLAYPPFHRGQPLEIKRLVELALEEYQQQGSNDHALLAHLYNDLAYAIHALGSPKHALELAEQALAIRRERFGERHPDTATSLDNVAGYHDALGNPKHALELAEQALAIRREHFGELHPDTAMSLSNAAGYHDALGNPKRALELAEQALAVLREVFGERHPHTATSLDNIAAYHNALGNPKRALELAEQVLAIRRELFGERHPDTALSLNNVAGYHHALGKPKRALELAEQALAIQRELFGERHPNTATSLNNIAGYHDALGDPKHALELAEQALAIRRKVFGERHPDRAASLHDIAGYLRSLGKMPQAHTVAMRAWQLKKQMLGANHPSTLNTLSLLGRIPGFRVPSQHGHGTKRKKRK